MYTIIVLALSNNYAKLGFACKGTDSVIVADGCLLTIFYFNQNIFISRIFSNDIYFLFRTGSTIIAYAGSLAITEGFNMLINSCFYNFTHFCSICEQVIIH